LGSSLCGAVEDNDIGKHADVPLDSLPRSASRRRWSHKGEAKRDCGRSFNDHRRKPISLRGPDRRTGKPVDAELPALVGLTGQESY
jgi:hypothetical protein